MLFKFFLFWVKKAFWVFLSLFISLITFFAIRLIFGSMSCQTGVTKTF
ncbi:hypothetical protein HPNQ4076_1141 [Helicobacter pylori NQ4076]|uniref:Uncharacterized protein n=1 Tax=Helicobacter pylori NQ4076 TaxID=992029 RepID=I9QF04_HELPX|nr:hypothetical protein HPNQ4076_1141 [Helicobacter pylori NQ4076]